ncbi:hypothetical protein ACFWU3_27910 [Streptomyces sp. NPDC058685]|uniref:hypothetical protein n=1 Tax=Streptomyces sp. NPDC058685 TaxID=3346598 RepID=UPI00364AC388
MTIEDFRPTHVVPRDGLPAWEEPDVSRPTAPLDALLPVRLVDRRGDWGRIECANGWSAWVDGRLLVSVPQEPPATGQPLTRTADPRPLLTRAGESLGRYRRAAEELATGRTDGETFRRRTRGLRVGMVVDGESVWLYDSEHERWVYCDGARLSTFATAAGPEESAGPAARAAAPPEPTRVVDQAEARPEAAAPAQAGPEAAGPAQAGPEAAGPAPARAQPETAGPAEPAQARPEAAKPAEPAPARAQPEAAEPARVPPEPTRVVTPAPAPAEATRAVEPAQAQPRVPDDPVPKDGEETRRVPPADDDPVPPADDDSDPPARPGDR